MKNDPKILLVEDNAGDAELIKEALKCNAVVTELQIINNGEDAIRFLKQEDEFENGILPDLILLDVNLPKVDGKEILRFVKSDKDLKRIPVVMLTTSSLQKDINYSYDNHANCYIVKPGNLTEFMSAINSIEGFWTKCVTYPKRS